MADGSDLLVLLRPSMVAVFLPLLPLSLSRLQLSHEMDESTSRVVYWKRILSLFSSFLSVVRIAATAASGAIWWWLGKRWDNLKAIKSALKYHTWHHRLRIGCMILVCIWCETVERSSTHSVVVVCAIWSVEKNVILMAFAFTYHLFRRDRSAFVEQKNKFLRFTWSDHPNPAWNDTLIKIFFIFSGFLLHLSAETPGRRIFVIFNSIGHVYWLILSLSWRFASHGVLRLHTVPVRCSFVFFHLQKMREGKDGRERSLCVL